MSITEVATTNGKSEKKKSTISHADFIRARPTATVEEIIEAGKAEGLEITRDRVNTTRRLAKKNKPKKEKVSKSVEAKRKEAGRKAAETRAAKKRETEKAETHAKVETILKDKIKAKEREFLNLATEIGFVRSEELLVWLRDEALKGV